MKSIFVLATLALSALAQRASIVAPTNGSTVTAGQPLFIQVHQEESTSDEVQVAIVLGLAFCPNSSCEGVDPSSTGVGTILYNGPFNPQDLPSMPALGLHQNFTVNISPFANAGPMLLTLTHLELTGAEKIPLLEQSAITVNVVGSEQ